MRPQHLKVRLLLAAVHLAIVAGLLAAGHALAQEEKPCLRWVAEIEGASLQPAAMAEKFRTQCGIDGHLVQGELLTLYQFTTHGEVTLHVLSNNPARLRGTAATCVAHLATELSGGGVCSAEEAKAFRAEHCKGQKDAPAVCAFTPFGAAAD